MITIENLVKDYKKTRAVDGLTLTIADNEVFALLGLNGAGKSTTINILCSLVEKTSGKVIVDGLDLDSDAEKIKSFIGVSPQETAIAGNLTVRENLEFIADLYGIEDKTATDEMIKQFALTEKSDKRAKTLSGGQKRRLSLAMALIQRPRILVLDEPTLGLDIKARRELWSIIESCKNKITIILTTHYLEEAQALADRIGIMNKGRLAALGTVQEIIDVSGKQNFEDAFLKFAEDGANE